MGIIECQLDDSYKKNEMEKELKIKEDEGSLCIIEYNKTKNFENNKKKRNSNESKTKNININEIKSKNSNNINEPYIDDNCLSKNDYDFDPNKNNNDILKIKINNKREITINDNNNKNDEDLIIITPRNNKLMYDNYNNEITDEHTIKNETLVYNFENKCSKDISKNLNEIENEENDNLNTNNKDNKSINKLKINNSKSFVTKRIVTKKPNLNKLNKDIPKNRNMKNKSNNKNINKQRNIINHLNNKSYNNIRNLKSCLFPPMFDYSFLKNNENEIQQSSTLQNQNNQLKNIILQQLKEDILPNVERKTYQEDFFSFKEKNKSNNKFYFESKKNNLKYDKALFNKLCEEQNKYLLFGNDDNKLIMDKIKNIYQVLYNKNSNENENEKINRKNNKREIDLSKNLPIYKNETNFHLRNKSYNIGNNFSMNNDNNNNNNNSYFSLFNNSTNLSINFINKANKCNNKSERNCKKVSPFFFDNKITKNNKNQKRRKLNNKEIKKEVTFNQFLNYNNFNKKNYSNIKDRKNKTYIKKVRPFIFNSKSYNNIFNNNEKKLNYSNNDINMNHIHLLSHEYRDLVEVSMPKLEEETLININIINSIIGNKYIYSYKKIDNFMNDTILYDGILYKVIDNMDNENMDKYQLLERYFQITKNCFKYYNFISEAMHDKDKPLVQFDIRYIEKIEIIENNFLENYKIDGEKDIKIIFCIYINQNNDFFIFAHNDRNFGIDVINILQFLQRYYEDMQ